MLAFIMEHPIITLIIVLSVLWAVERVIVSAVNRNKPSCNKPCCKAPEEE